MISTAYPASKTRRSTRSISATSPNTWIGGAPTGPSADQQYSHYWRNGEKIAQNAKHEEASDATLRRERSMLNGMFKHAVKLGYMNKGGIPDQDTPKAKSQPRQPLTRIQFAKLFETSNQRLVEAVWQPDIFYQRGVLHCFVNLQDIVFDCVESHSFPARRIPVYLEGRAIQDADKIDALG
jgi:hypothetical protein